jgi:hypothetical protein
MRRLTLASFALGAFLTACSDEAQITNVRRSEQAVVIKTLDFVAKRISRAELLAKYDPVVVYLPTMTCEGLNLKENWARGDTTVCFDRNGRQVLHYLNGE